MKHFLTFLLFCNIFIGFSQKNNSPYLLIEANDADVSLKSTKTAVEISGTIAHVKVTQVYQNNGKLPIEAKYVFPLSTKAAVHKMQMTIGERIVNAKIFEKKEAEKVYKKAINNGQRAAKLDQHRPNVFQMNVGNILSNEEVVIDVYYTEMLSPVDGSYQFVAPAVVGPRYTGESSTKNTSFKTLYSSKEIINTLDYDISVAINSGIIIQNINSSSHKVNVKYSNTKKANVFLSKSNVNPGNRDFILNYSLRGNQVASGLLLYEHKDENFFALQIEPTKKVELKNVPSREYLFIVDVSGSMNGYPLEVSKELMRNLLCNLRSTDTFNVQLFASSATVFSKQPVEVSEYNIESAIDFLSDGQGGGGTNLLSALKEAYDLPRKDISSARSMVVITDGYISVEKEAFELIKRKQDEANVFTFGIGSSVNRYLIEGMAKVSNSESFVATSKKEALTVANSFKKYIESPLLTQVKIKTKGFDIYDVAPTSIPDVFSARPVLVFGKYKGKPEGSIIITGYQGKKRFKQEFKVSSANVSAKNKSLRYLWARKQIAELDDYNKLFNDNVKEKVTALGLQYNLVTNYTSFVAVDETVANKNGKLKTVHQPLPMPQHVHHSGVGAGAKVVAKSTFKKSFTIKIKENLIKTDKRNIKMEFKVLYSKLISKYLKTNKSLRIKFNKQGRIVSVEILNNNQWSNAIEIFNELTKKAVKPLSIHKNMTLIISK